MNEARECVERIDGYLPLDDEDKKELEPIIAKHMTAREAKLRENIAGYALLLKSANNDVKRLKEYADKLEGKTARLVEALEKLSRLGNEPNLGNSIGNQIAQQALAEAGKGE